MRRSRNRSFRRSPLAVALMVVGGLLTTAMAAQGDGQTHDTRATEIDAQAIHAQPQSRMEGDVAMDSAVAAALIGAITLQFDEHDVGVKLDDLAVAPASLRDRAVSGEGRLRIGEDERWIPFRFDAQYDTYTASVSYPYLVIGGDAPEASVALDSDIARALDRQVDEALAEEFSQQPVAMTIQRVATGEAGDRYLRVLASGIADFAGEGSTAARIRALYDRDTGEWLRLDYELGPAADRRVSLTALR